MQGTLWEAGDKEFIIEKVDVVEAKRWIFYRNIKTEQQYSCLEEAFLHRFRPVVNKEYGIHSRK